MKAIVPFIKYITLIFLLVGLTILFANKKIREKTFTILKLKEEQSNRLEVKFKKAVDTNVTEEGKKEIISANNRLALNLYAYLSSENPNKNIFFSPYGIFTAMAMAYEGASGQTANEIQSVFYFPEDHNVRRPAIAYIYNQLNEPKTGYKFLTANALWIHENLQSKIFNEIQKYYGAEVFTNTSARKINEWIEYKTMNKFKNVVKECHPTNNELCGLSVINTIYFKGDWKQKFKKSKIKKKLFIIGEKEKVKVPMMNMTKTFNYMEIETMQMLEMPYKGEKFSMLILLPKDFPGKSKKKENHMKKSVADTTKHIERAGLISLEKALTEENLRAWRKTLFRKKVKVYIPKFTFKKKYNLSNTLKRHMPLAFDKKKANFKKFAENIEKPEQNLYIKDIIHKSFIDVNEKGTEASAITTISLGLTSIPPPPPIFKADHPFVFLIQERETGQILFVGKVVNPKK